MLRNTVGGTANGKIVEKMQNNPLEILADPLITGKCLKSLDPMNEV
jgi:hypothetical protein